MPQHWDMAGDMATGAFAQVLAGVVYTPIDIVKERMQVRLRLRLLAQTSCIQRVDTGNTWRMGVVFFWLVAVRGMNGII